MKRLGDLEEAFVLPRSLPAAEPSWFGFPLTLRDERLDREALVQQLNVQGVATRLLFAGNILRQPYFVEQDLPHRVVGTLDETDRILRRSFWVGVYPALEERHLDHVAATIREFLDGRS